MNIYMAFSLFSLIVLLYWVITELFGIFFRFTGLPDEKARFQVISLLTGCGFTTRESEMILSNRPRRRLARITMKTRSVLPVQGQRNPEKSSVTSVPDSPYNNPDKK